MQRSLLILGISADFSHGNKCVCFQQSTIIIRLANDAPSNIKKRRANVNGDCLTIQLLTVSGYYIK